MAKYAYPIPNGKVNSEGLTKIISTLYTASGVVYPGSLTVSANGTPDMNIRVSGSLKDDVAVFIGPEGIAYTGWNTTPVSVAISANATGVTKKDTIIAYIDLTKGSSTTANAPDGLSFMAVRGVGTNTAPTDSAITALIGHSLWIRLADVTVTNGATSINSGNISNQRVQAQLKNSNIQPLTQTQAPFALAMHSNNLKMQIVVEGPPFWNGLANGAYQSGNVIFNQLSLVHAAWMIPGKGPAGNNGVTALEWALEEQFYSSHARFLVRNLAGGPVYSNFCIYIAIGTPI